MNGDLIRQLREADGLRQKDLLHLCEASNDTTISERSLRTAESGKSVGVDIYLRLARVLRVAPADQLLKEKALTLKDVKRAKDEAAARAEREVDQERAIDRIMRPKADEGPALARLSLDTETRRQLRHLLLTCVTPKRAYTLNEEGYCFHEAEIKSWTRSVFEGFLTACAYYVQDAILLTDGSESGNGQAIFNAVMMGIHLQKVWGSGEEDDQKLSINPSVLATFDKALSESSLGPVGRHSEILHLHCPACEANSFYYGWREFCLWLMTNSINADETAPSRTQDDYRGMVLNLIHGYLWRFENQERYGFDIFWSVVRVFLRIDIGGEENHINDAALRRIDGYTSSQMFERIRDCLEVGDTRASALREILEAYPDEATGREVAILRLQTEFIYTGKPKGLSAEIRAALHP